MWDTFEYAFGKLNLSLDIVGKQENGYHLLQMVMQSVSLYDSVTLIRDEGVSGLQVSCGSGAPSGPENIVWRLQTSQMLARENTVKSWQIVPLSANRSLQFQKISM